MDGEMAMKHALFASVGALAAALLMTGSANALTYVANSSNTSGSFQLSGSTTLEVSTVSNTEFVFQITNPTDTWTGAATLLSFAFNGNIIGTTGTITASETSPGSQPGIYTAGGQNSSGCDMSGFGGGFCFTFTPPVGVASVMDFDIKTTGAFDYSSTNVPDLKINFRDATGGFDGNGAGQFSSDIPFCASGCPVINPTGGGGVPEPATWSMMIVGVGMIGAAMRRRRKMALTMA
jgi:hypothetical protein